MRTFLAEFSNSDDALLKYIADEQLCQPTFSLKVNIFRDMAISNLKSQGGGCETAASLRFSANIDFRHFHRNCAELAKLWKAKLSSSLRQTFLLFGSKKNNQYWLSYGHFSAKIENRFGAFPEIAEIACLWAKIDFQSYWALQERYDKNFGSKVVQHTYENIFSTESSLKKEYWLSYGRFSSKTACVHSHSRLKSA